MPWRKSSLYGTLRALAAAVDLKAGYMPGHSDGVAYLMGLMAREAGYDPATVERLELAALLHDLGKLQVPEVILTAQRRLTDEEFAIIRAHPQNSCNLVRTLEGLADVEEVATWVLHHHEHWDGSGYPDGLTGENIPWPSRMILVADAFHVITTDRPYQRSRTRIQALAILREQTERQFCPFAVSLLESRHNWVPASPPLSAPPTPIRQRTDAQPTDQPPSVRSRE